MLHFKIDVSLNIVVINHVPVQCVPLHPFRQPVEQFPVSTEQGTPCLQWPQSKVQLVPYLKGSHSMN